MIYTAVFGGGASGFFAAIYSAITFPNEKTVIFEKSQKLLSKVKVSGGGRCNVTHACFEIHELVENYPRGKKELPGPFHRFMTFDTIDFFNSRGIILKTENDGRIFPESDSSQTIIDCLINETKKLNIVVEIGAGIMTFTKRDNVFECELTNGKRIHANRIIMATGSNEAVWEMLMTKGISTIKPVPSLFTFNVPDKSFHALMGLSVQKAIVSIKNFSDSTEGPLLFTHWGLSGPAILKMSALAARFLHDLNYNFICTVNFVGFDKNEFQEFIRAIKKNNGSLLCSQIKLDGIPTRLIELLIEKIGFTGKQIANLRNDEIEILINSFTNWKFQILGKTTFKEEFVTCGGVDLREVEMKTMESKKIPGLFFTGECLNIDGVTGGFNFQAAWTTGYLAGKNSLKV